MSDRRVVKQHVPCKREQVNEEETGATGWGWDVSNQEEKRAHTCSGIKSSGFTGGIKHR